MLINIIIIIIIIEEGEVYIKRGRRTRLVCQRNTQATKARVLNVLSGETSDFG